MGREIEEGMKEISPVISHLSWGGERTTIYKGVETFL